MKYKNIFLIILSILMLSSFVSATIDVNDGVSLYYTFDSTNISGSTLLDLTSNNINGNCIMASNCDSVAGKINQASDFSGTEQINGIVSGGSITIKSINFWIYYDDFSQSSYIGLFTDGKNGLRGSHAGVETTWNIYTGSSNRFFTYPTVEANWFMATLVFNGTNLLYYKNGIYNGTITANGYYDLLSGWELGYNTFDSNGLNGKIDEFGIWNRELSQEEITFLYNNNNGLQYPFPPMETNFTITLKNYWNNSALTNFSALVNGTVYNDLGTGTITTGILTDNINLFDITVYKSNYFNQTYTNINASLNNTYQASLYQNIFTYYLKELFSENPISNYNITFDSNNFTVTGNNITIYPNTGTTLISNLVDNTGTYTYYLDYSSILIGGYLNIVNFTSHVYQYNMNITAVNDWNNNSITTFNATVYNFDLGTSRFFSTTNGSIYIPMIPDSYTIYINSPGYFETINSFLMSGDVDYESRLRESDIKVIFNSVFDTESLIGLNVTINDSNVTFHSDSTTEEVELYLAAGTYTVTAGSDDYQYITETFTVLPLDNKTLTYELELFGHFNIYDEATGELFNMSSPTSVELLLVCPNETITFDINDTNVTIPITCDYTKFRVVVYYNLSNYYRTYIIPYTELLDFDIYLIDLLTTSAVVTNFVLDDLFNEYVGTSLYLKRAITGEIVDITNDYTDIENKITAYLIENAEYQVELHSENKPTRLLGNYAADASGQKIIKLYTIGTSAENPGGLTNVLIGMGKQNITGSPFIVATYEDLENITTSIRFEVRTNSPTGAILFSGTTTDNDYEFQYNLSGNENNLIYGIMNVTRTGNGNFARIQVLNEYNEIKLDLFDSGYVSKTLLTWIITFLLGAIALYATAANGSIVAVIIVTIAAITKMFGWFPIPTGILAMIILIVFLALIKGGKKSDSINI